MDRLNDSEHITKITKDLISSLFYESLKNYDDGTGYIKSVKTIIQGLASYLEKNGRIDEFENVLKKLHKYSKQLWIKNLSKNCLTNESDSTKSDVLYFDYCFDHIYEKGDFPL